MKLISPWITRWTFCLLLLTAVFLIPAKAADEFVSTGSLASARYDHTATLLTNGKLLVAGGIGGSSSSAELYDPASGLWSTTGSLAFGRYYHAATSLPNGKVLVAGGYNTNADVLASAELYDPASGLWSTTGPLATARYLHTTTLLANGKLLVVGGSGSNGQLSSAELYDPATGLWSATGALATARGQHTATLLGNGKLLVAGGYNSVNGYLSSTESYDPATGLWSATGSLATARQNHTATLLANGKLLVAGGYNNGSYLSSAELYDPATGLWSTTGSLATAHYLHTATLLANGKLLVAGGYGNGILSSAELYQSELTAPQIPLQNSPQIAAWGLNTSGQLGNGGTISSSVPSTVNENGVLAGRTVVAVAAGQYHSLALCADGGVGAWGQNSPLWGQLGNGSSTSSSSPVAVSQDGVLAGRRVTAVAAGYLHNLALCADGTLAAWGSNTSGKLGNGNATTSKIPVAVDQSGVLAGKTVVAISAGSQHSMALCSDGSIATWGLNTYGQLGNNSTAASNVPVAVNQSGALAGKRVIAISAGYFHSLALCADGTLVGWGFNLYGQLGNGSTSNSLLPVAAVSNGGIAGTTVVAVSAGQYHNLALGADGRILAWGQNSNGKLGDGGTTNSSVPVTVNQSGVLSGKGVIAVSAGSQHSTALCSDGTVAAWGLNTNGQLGDGGTATSFLPVLVDQSGGIAGSKVTAISAGYTHNLGFAPATLSNNSSLSALSLSSGNLSPNFDSSITAYTVSEVSAVSTMTVIPTLADSSAVLTLNGKVFIPNPVGAAIPLVIGSNTLTIQVVAQDGVSATTYTVTFTRAPAKVTLTLTNVANGTVVGAGEYEPGSIATLIATARPGYVFTGWTGNASGSANPFAITMVVNQTIGATFSPDNADSDGDGTNNYDEIVVHASDPNNARSVPGDVDGDGLADAWEIRYFGDLAQSPTGDYDQDGLLNQMENGIGTNPTLADTDGDGFKDGQEIALGRNPLKIEMDFTLGSLSQEYDGAPKTATANTNPAGIPVKFTYDGTETLPFKIGTYAVVGTIDDATYIGSASGTLVISEGTATVTLGALSAGYDGNSKSATASTTPAGLVVNLTYDGSADAPTNAGSYAVVGTVSDLNYRGAASGTLVIAKGEAPVTLENLVQIRDGSAKHATAITDPPGLTVEFTYSPSAGAPVETGNYTVMGTIRDANFSGSAIGTLALLSSPTISVQPASVLASQGAPVTFRVEADGNNLVYQWQKDGVNIEGAISASLTIAQAQLVDVGSYSAMISNVVGSITSAPAVLIASFGPGDNDGDGLTNDEEIVVYHTNPNQSDTDGDGLTDGHEAGLGRFSVLLGTFTWDQARLSAIAEGGNLATFTSEAEWDLALWSLGFEALFDVNGLWVGASDAAVEGTWGWVTGEAFSFAPWAVGQPDNLNNSDYAAVAGDLGGDSGKWYDFRKATTRDGYILETGYTTDPTVADADGDGLNDSQEQAAGSNPFTADTDGDGLTDGEEVQQSRTHPRLADSNSDGTNDSADDADGDGLSNLTEIRSNLTNPVLADTDGDGLSDGAEVNSHRTNPLVADTDGDGYSDGYEVAMASDPVKAGSVPTFTLTLSDGGMVTGGSFYLTGSLAHGTTATLKAVADAGYVFSNWTGNLAGSVDPQTLLMDENKSVGATFIPDTQDADDDGLTNYQESVTYGTNPNLGDTDADGLTDAAELQVNLTNPKVPDTDGDGLTDGSEISVTGTNPLVADTDGDSYLDGYEEANSSNPKSADSFPTYGLQLEAGGEMVGGRFSKSGSLGHGTQAQLTALAAEGYLFMGWTGDLSGAVNPQLLLMDSNKTVGASFVNDTRDSDADGLTNYEEVVVYGTNPVLADSDADGLSDGSENQTDHTNPLLADTDGDGLSDGVEVLIQHTNPLVADTDGDGHSDGYEVANASDPSSSVSFPTFMLRLGDGGKVTGGSFSQTGSLAHGGSVVLTALADAGYVFSVWTGDLTGATNPQTLRMDGDKAVGATFIHDILDTDGDGLTNFEEAVTYGTSPSLTDTDGDGLSDSAEIRTHQTNPSRADSNGDGLADGVAVRMGLEPLADHAALVRIILDSRETFGLHTLQDLTDLRPGSTTVKVLPSAGGLQLRLKVQQSADLKNWQDAGEAVFEQTVDPTVQKKFFRFGVE